MLSFSRQLSFLFYVFSSSNPNHLLCLATKTELASHMLNFRSCYNFNTDILCSASFLYITEEKAWSPVINYISWSDPQNNMCWVKHIYYMCANVSWVSILSKWTGEKVESPQMRLWGLRTLKCSYVIHIHLNCANSCKSCILFTFVHFWPLEENGSDSMHLG